MWEGIFKQIWHGGAIPVGKSMKTKVSSEDLSSILLTGSVYVSSSISPKHVSAPASEAGRLEVITSRKQKALMMIPNNSHLTLPRAPRWVRDRPFWARHEDDRAHWLQQFSSEFSKYQSLLGMHRAFQEHTEE